MPGNFDDSLGSDDPRENSNRTDNHERDQHEVIMSSSQDEIIPAPRDEYNFVYFGFAILGLTTLLPWCCFTTATDYWMYKFRNVTMDGGLPSQRTPLQVFFESYLAIASNFALLSSMMINTIYGQKFAQKTRLYGSLSIMLAVFITTTIFVPINTDHMQNLFFGVTMVLVILISFFSAVFQAAIFGIAASFPSHCMHAMVNGQAIAGLLAVAIQVLSMVRDSGPISSGLWYFLASTFFLAFATVYYWCMDNDYTRHYLINQQDTTRTLNSGLVTTRADLADTLKDCWQFASASLLVFWATLSVFPGVCVLVLPQNPNLSWLDGRFYIPIVTFFLFNLGDLSGRLCASYVPPPTGGRNALLTAAVVRSILPLLVLFCNIHPRTYTAVWFTNDMIYPILITLIGLTNGYLFSAAMVMASKSCRKHRSELTGFIMASAMGAGLLLGSITSTILLRII